MGLFNRGKSVKRIETMTTKPSKPIPVEHGYEKEYNEPEEQIEEEVVKEKPVRKEIIKKETKEEKDDDKIVQVPVFLSEQDVFRMVYENNLMLRKIVSEIEEEKNKE